MMKFFVPSCVWGEIEKHIGSLGIPVVVVQI